MGGERTRDIPPVVEALADWYDLCRLTTGAAYLRDHAAKIAKIIAAHQPPDKLDELLAAMRNHETAGGCELAILEYGDGSGRAFGLQHLERPYDADAVASWGIGDEAAAAIRAATERLRPKAEPCALCGGYHTVSCDACEGSGSVACPRCCVPTPNP